MAFSSPSPAVPSLFADVVGSANCTSFPMAQPLLFLPLSTTSSPRATLVTCHSTSSKPITATSGAPQPQQASPPTPSLADQLRPLSLTILKEHRPQEADHSNKPQLHPSRKSKSTWVNPSRPRRKALSLQRQPRSSPSSSPDLKLLSILSHKISSLHLPEDVDDISTFATFSATLNEALPEPPSRDTALFLLNGLRPWHKAYRFFQWLKAGEFFAIETIFYNVAMKSLRLGKRYDLVDRLASEMVESGTSFDNITYSTVITACKRLRRFDAAISWFEMMYETGMMPDEVTYSAILDVYAKLGKVGDAMALFERGRSSGWTPDPVAFAVLGKMFGETGDYEGIKYVLSEMSNLGVSPNLVVYNTLLEAMGKAGKPGVARKLFEEMVASGLSPNEKTLTALIKIYGKARWSRDALELWERMKANKWPADFILYNTLLSMCADLGLEVQAEELFADMKAAKEEEKSLRPDSWSYTAMANIYATAGRGDKAMQVFQEMLGSGVEPNVMTCTCLIQCFGKAGRVDDAVKVFDVAMERGIRPDDRLRCCLLSVISACREEGEMDKVVACLEKAGPRFVNFIQLLITDDASFDVIKEEFRVILNEADSQSRRPICNCFIDVCRTQNFPSHRAQELFSLGVVYGLYPNLHGEVGDEWSLNLRSLSVGAAYTAFEAWVSDLDGKVRDESGCLPRVFSVCTSTGSQKFSNNGLSTAFAAHVEQVGAPFRQDVESGGQFVTTREELVCWMQARAGASSPAAVLVT